MPSTFKNLLEDLVRISHMNSLEVSSGFTENSDSAGRGRSSSTGFSLCTVNGPQLKPHRLKPVLLKTATRRNAIRRSKLTEQICHALVRYPGEKCGGSALVSYPDW